MKRKTLLRTILMLFLFWLLAVGVIYQLKRSTDDSYLLVNKLMTELDSVRTLFILRTPTLSLAPEQLTENISRVKSLQVDLRVAQRKTLIRPDFEHLIRSSGDYLNGLERLSTLQLDLQSFVQHLRFQRDKYAGNPNTQRYFDRIGVSVFDAFYSNGDGAKLSYREFNQLYQQGDQLAPEQADDLNTSLALANKILVNYARAEAIINQLSANEVFKEKARIEEEFRHSLMKYNYVYAAIGLLSLIWLVFVGWQQSQPKLVVAKPIDKADNEDLSQAININHMVDFLDGDTDAIKQLLDVFIQDHQDDAHKLKQAINHSDDKQAIIISHSLKGVSASLGADSLNVCAEQIESGLKNGETPTDSQLDMLENRLNHTISFAREYVTKAPVNT